MASWWGAQVFFRGGGAPGPETLPNLFDIRFCIRSKNRNILLVFCSSPHTTNCLVSYPGNIYNLKKKELLKECGYPAVLPQVPDSAYHFHLIHDEGGETCTIHLQPLHFDWTVVRCRGGSLTSAMMDKERSTKLTSLSDRGTERVFVFSTSNEKGFGFRGY